MRDEKKIFGNLEPWAGHKTPVGLATSVDFYKADFPKGGAACEFHSLWELLHAALSESNPQITSHISQGKAVAYKKRPAGVGKYFGDALIKSSLGTFLDELKPATQIKDGIPLTVSAEALNAIHRQGLTEGFSFRLISNEEVAQKQILAKNWLRLSRWLLHSPPKNHAEIHASVLRAIHEHEELSIGPLITYLGLEADLDDGMLVIAYCLWSGEISSNLDELPLSKATLLRQRVVTA